MFNATFTSNENRKTEIRLNRITKTVSFESVNVDSGFFLLFCFVFVFVSLATRRKTSLFPKKKLTESCKILQGVFIASFYGKLGEITKV